MNWQLLNLCRLFFVPNAAILVVDIPIEPDIGLMAEQNLARKVGSSWNFSRAHRAKRCRLEGRRKYFPDEMPNNTERK